MLPVVVVGVSVPPSVLSSTAPVEAKVPLVAPAAARLLLSEAAAAAAAATITAAANSLLISAETAMLAPFSVCGWDW